MPVGTYAGIQPGYKLIGFSDTRFFLNTSTLGVSMVVNGAPVNDVDGNPSPRVEMLYNKNFNSSDSNSHSMNYTGAVMNFMPGPATWTCVGQVSWLAGWVTGSSFP